MKTRSNYNFCHLADGTAVLYSNNNNIGGPHLLENFSHFVDINIVAEESKEEWAHRSLTVQNLDIKKYTVEPKSVV